MPSGYPAPPLYTKFGKGSWEVRSDHESIHLECPGPDRFVAQEVLGGEYPIPPRAYAILRGMPVVDIGAHVGFTVAYWRLLLKPRVIHAYEPNPESLAYLQRNLRGIVEAEIFAEAVGEWSGMTELLHHPRALCMASTVAKPWECRTELVPCVHAGEALGRIEGEIGILKIDAEEAEADILTTAREDLSRIRVVYVEHHGEDLRREVDDVLREKGFYLFHGDYTWTRGVSGYIHPDYALELYDESDFNELRSDVAMVCGKRGGGGSS